MAQASSVFKNHLFNILPQQALERLLKPSLKSIKPTQPIQITTTSPKILVAEDDRANQMVTSLWLKEYGYDHQVVDNGEDAVKMCKTGQFPIIFMDVEMHKLNGFEATKLIREYEKKNNLRPAIIIAFTAHGFLDDRQKCLQNGMDDYFSKPVNYPALNDSLSKYIAALGKTS